MYKPNEAGTFLALYRKRAIRFMEDAKGRPLDSESLAKLDRAISERPKDADEDVAIEDNVRNERNVVPLSTLFNFLHSDLPILTGYGALYRSAEADRNHAGNMLKGVLDMRRKYKADMMRHVNDKDQVMYNALSTRQKNLKIVANSWYGASNQPAFMLYNQTVGASITYTAHLIISGVMVAVEGFMANSVRMANAEELYGFVFETLEDLRECGGGSEWGWILEGSDALDLDTIVKRLSGMCDFSLDERELLGFVGSLGPRERAAVHLRSNLKAFLGLPAVEAAFGDCFDVDFTDPENPPESVRAAVDRLAEAAVASVGHLHLHADRLGKAIGMKRESVLVVDTDSVFVRLDDQHRWFEEKVLKGEADAKAGVAVNAVFIRIVMAFIRAFLERLTACMNVPAHLRRWISMKSEFLYSRLLLTGNKKNYAGRMVCREGDVLKAPVIDVKGLQFKKVGTPKATREFFGRMLREDVLERSPVDIVGVFEKIGAFKDEVRRSLVDRLETTYAIPKSYSSVGAYKTPFRLEQVRGVLLWNMLHPENTIQPHEKINFLKLKGATAEQCAEALADRPRELGVVMDGVFGNESLAKYGVTGISLPKKEERIPECLAGMVDVEEMCLANVSPFLPVMESLGFHILPTARNSRQLTGFISL